MGEKVEKFVRLAQPADFARVDELVAEAYGNAYGDLDNSWDEWREAAKRVSYPQDIWVVCLAESERIVGTISSRKFGERAVYDETLPEEMDLRLLAADPQLPRSGVGRFMMEWIMGEAQRQGFKRILLKTDSEWTNVHRLYESLGWYRFTERDGIYEDGVKEPGTEHVICFAYDF